jgi:hypothetical protein
MRMISIPIQLNDERSAAWIKKMGKGFSPDKTLLQLVGFDAEMEVTLSHDSELRSSTHMK